MSRAPRADDGAVAAAARRLIRRSVPRPLLKQPLDGSAPIASRSGLMRAVTETRRPRCGLAEPPGFPPAQR